MRSPAKPKVESRRRVGGAGHQRRSVGRRCHVPDGAARAPEANHRATEAPRPEGKTGGREMESGSAKRSGVPLRSPLFLCASASRWFKPFIARSIRGRGPATVGIGSHGVRGNTFGRPPSHQATGLEHAVRCIRSAEDGEHPGSKPQVSRFRPMPLPRSVARARRFPELWRIDSKCLHENARRLLVQGRLSSWLARWLHHDS